MANLINKRGISIVVELGSYEVPETRLIACLVDLRKLYDNLKTRPSTTLEMAKTLGFVAPTSGGFYRKLKSLEAFGLIQNVSRGVFQVTQLGASLLFEREDENRRGKLLREAVMNVKLWAELYKEKGKNPPEKMFGLLSSITKAEPSQIDKHQEEIRRWYIEDIAQVPDEVLQLVEEEQTQGLSSTSANYNAGANQPKGQGFSPMMSTASVQQQGLKPLTFENMTIFLPEYDMRNAWDRLQKYMKVYLEMHPETTESPTQKHEGVSGEQSQEQ
jgi:hypothetical protein